MTNETLDLPGSNPYRSEKPVRQLDAEDLGVTIPDSRDDERTEIWEELQNLVEANPTNEIIVGVATADETLLLPRTFEKVLIQCMPSSSPSGRPILKHSPR